MSVLVVIKIPADTKKFEAFAAANKAILREFEDQGKALGAVHHRFGVGDGVIFVIDEWGTREEFEAFFANPQMASVMQEAGAMGAPAFEFYEAIDTTDEF